MVPNKTDQMVEKFIAENTIESYPVDIISICKRYDIKVFEEYLPEHVSGFIIEQEVKFDKYDANKVIVVNSSNTPERRRFTIAHELAHHILHKKDDLDFFAHRDIGIKNIMETEANRFASGILMPQNLLKDFLLNLKEAYGNKMPLSFKAIYVSNEFAVSIRAAEVRLKQIGEK